MFRYATGIRRTINNDTAKPHKFKGQYYQGEYGLPNTVRESLLQSGQGEISLTLDIAYHVGYHANDTFTVAEFLLKMTEFGISCSPYLIRRALSQYPFVSDNLPCTGRGRPTRLYIMPHLDSLVKYYADGQYGQADILHKSDLQSLHDYRAGLYRELIHRAPGQYPRAWLAARLGVCKQTTANYDKQEGITVKPNFEDTRLDFPDAESMPTKLGNVRSAWLVVYDDNGCAKNYPYIRSLALKFLFQGLQVIMRRQLANSYSWEPRYIW